MKDFIYTGFHVSTMTTADDPLIRVYSVDDGMSWTLKFYVFEKLIDVIDLKNCSSLEIHPNVLPLLVYNDSDQCIGNVGKMINEAIHLYSSSPFDEDDIDDLVAL